ncbi:MAG: glycosyltransferase [Mesorhizobium sp.]|uniref:trifunctional glycosyltransferase/class I SAM-dependent methyltransferase/polysaccharide deacetylase n=2 Tax=Mesorhizobium TaxID=68287 RepID=UPI000F7552B2|nr:MULTISPECIES: trifunctional glycosyltransferase/class I SAM-dependent methyltransferase/polysaccharide deacetylase [unclassified Mesorhizobium]RVD73290.1 glycosyltransferase [Mesorhizobium sp. M4A.F.Ca.ET.029.04.2.1]AZO51582.1 glycosyltransferase [Mesorhizobium sp. M4B.F.Ca.ET.058.02.1.1]RVC42151.1 glycosyltransferase [Mesorhizobium sp. M4A.F.Ca.ET.090.04.2.1]RVD41872.1 glycosyltransferase [Mesorhizobium sp. M4A.F.Ca.ET.020.02.1.1]RWC22157.1 MAG: glycosyltransferase [Mesorhizobium sp.]
MAHDPLVSIVVPAHNAEATLARALDCLLDQQMADWEAIIVDDASTDRTPSIIAGYVQRDARFRTLRSCAYSAAAARNSGISTARGHWLMFLDADDWVDASFLAKMLAALETAADAAAVYCGSRRVMPDGELTPSSISTEVAIQPFETFARQCAVCTHALLVDRETIVELGGFDVSLRTCEDWDLWQRLARLGKNWVMVDEPLAFYRISPNSLSRDSTQMLADAGIVIARGFSPDSRVKDPAAAHANGAIEANGCSASEALAWFALWNTASDCGRSSLPIDPQSLRALPVARKWAREIARVAVDGLMVGSLSVPAQLAARWDRFGGAITELIIGLGKVWDNAAAARRVQYHLEQMLLEADDLAAPRSLARTLGLRVDARNPTSTELPEGTDQIYAHLIMDGQIDAVVQFGVLGTVTTDHWIELILDILPPDRLSDSAEALSTAERRSDPDSHFGKLAQLAAEALELVRSSAEPAEPPATPRRARTTDRSDRTAFWNSYFATEDPWSYGSRYEQEKYERQLEILPAGPIGRALELACAEGHFTRQLAPRVGRLTATDISAIAIERAGARCSDQPNVEFGVLDFAADTLPGGMDLIFCSEVLYYLDDLAELRRIAKKFAEALAPGGSFISAHAFVLRDNVERTGFDWNTFGAKAISETLAATEGLVLEQSIQTELYRIDRFRRLSPDDVATEPVIDYVPIRAPIEISVARNIVWGGARALRRDVARNERRQRIPVLMYHSVSDDGPAALARFRLTPTAFASQMRWLRANGFHAINSEQLEGFIANRSPFVGRPVLITFDDGFQNFADHAWPTLRANDLTAEVFLVTDLVGESARWDAEIGPPTQLMDAGTVRRLSAEGAFFGSHLATHRAIDGLSSSGLAAELLRSRMVIERWIGRPTTAFAAPFSVTDRRLGRLARECGYRIGFGGRHGPADLDCDPIDLPRIEVRGDRSLDDFVAIVEAVLE